jgi:hypothetical protein
MSAARPAKSATCATVIKTTNPYVPRYGDNQGRPYRQTDVCETQAREAFVEMKVIDRGSAAMMDGRCRVARCFGSETYRVNGGPPAAREKQDARVRPKTA